MKNPREKFSHVISDNGWSDALFDHKAVTFDPLSMSLAIPINTLVKKPGEMEVPFYQHESKLYVVQTDSRKGFLEFGFLSIKQSTEEQDNNIGNSTTIWPFAENVLRSIFAEDYVYAIGTEGITVAKVKNLSIPVAKLAFSEKN